MKLPLLLLALIPSLLAGQLGLGGATASWRGSLPPKPVADLDAGQRTGIEKRLAEVTAAFQAVKKHNRAADAHIFLKAVRYALDFQEWYDKKPEDGVKKANALLDEAARRIAALAKDETPWMEGTGQKVLGFYSNIDDSPQPYGVEIPGGLHWGAGKKPVPMWIWLHGRGDTATDLHFIHSRLMAKKPGQFQPKGTIVIHPFGRYCNGWKSAGETDVFEARDDAAGRFNVDKDRIALAGFSMGGAGAWHIGAHYADQWACVHTGAGFVDVRRYQKLTPEKMPPWYEQKLWGVYDVPFYARNFLNVPLISYSGETDSQRDSAEYMTEVLAEEGITRPHLIGPGMGHKYHPEVIKEVQQLIEAAVEKGRDPLPKKVVLQTRSQRYARMAWVTLLQVQKEWDEARIEAVMEDKHIKVTTQNVNAFWLDGYRIKLDDFTVTVDGVEVRTPRNYSVSRPHFSFARFADKWVVERDDKLHERLMKAGGSSMEDGLLGRFVVVLPEKSSGNIKVDEWVRGESARFIQRWRSLMRGDPIVMSVEQAMKLDAPYNSLVLWGTPASNPLIAQWLGMGGSEARYHQLGTPIPATWTDQTIQIGSRNFDPASHVLLAAIARSEGRRFDQVYGGVPSVIVNSGLTFREAHDRTNSLQNPKLPDWAVLDITQPPDAESAGKVVAADFFDENWQVTSRER